MENLQTTNFDVLKAISVLAKKLVGSHLKILRTKEFNDIDLTKELFMELLKERISKADIDVVKADVIPYIIDKRELDIWSNDYFLQLADMIVFK
jgi:hypothetical protein